MSKKRQAYPFQRLPNDLRQRIKAAERRIPGFWSTKELADLLGVGRTAILMQVNRNQIAPINSVQGQEHLFTDDEVARYLKTRRLPGRPKKNP